MSAQLALSVLAGNDIAWQFAITLDGETLDLSGYQVQTLIKASAATSDGVAAHTYSTTTSGVTVTDAGDGLVTWSVGRADVATPGTFWWRLDLLDGGFVYSALYGPLTIQAA